MGAHVWHCECPSHLSSGLSAWLECVHASVYACMCTWHLMSSWPPLHSYMSVCVWHSVCVSEWPIFWSQTLVRMCTCFSTCKWDQLTYHVCSTPFEKLHGKHGCTCVTLCVCLSHLSSAPSAWLECVHASVYVCMCSWLPMSSWDPLYS